MRNGVTEFPRNRIARIGVDLAHQALSPDCDGYGESVLVLPTIRRDGIIAEPTFAEQAAAVAELHDVMRDIVLPKLPLLELRDADSFLQRLSAAAATLRRLERGEPL